MENFFYRVKSNETVMSLSQKFKVPVGILIDDNNLKREVEEGDLLYICAPIGDVYIVKPLDSIDSIAKKFGIEKQDLILKNKSPYFFYGEIIYI